MYIGHEPGVKGHRLYCAKPEKIVISRNVVFNETTCFFIDEPLPSVADLDPSIDNSTPPVQVQSTSDPTPDTLPPLRRSSRTKRLPSRFNDSSDLANSNGTSRGTSTTPTRDPSRTSSVTDSTSLPSATQPTESEHFNREQPSHPTPAPPMVTPTQTPAASAVPSNATAPRVPQQPEHTPVHVDNVQPEYIPVFDEPTISILDPDASRPPPLPDSPPPSPLSTGVRLTKEEWEALAAQEHRILMAYLVLDFQPPFVKLMLPMNVMDG
ncbi:unnamed protein product [Aphanomyces euteiches]|uniref:Retroviral polymerase SH3-like domain-containing protein n=1 Tax=Aphanomyces euteiches TaxID=100861 RepID=A0A6G0X3C5_9STRA|nr:hypothetical protein Ae201684_008875 [Aphanomyces euteiches]KAH9054397.1 hypothetical protein Ae201684P_018118 [Aphanomyces euteiches]